MIVQLQACNNYESQVRSLCAGVGSEWSELFFFSTPCYPLCDEIPEGLDTSQVGTTTTQLLWEEVEEAINYRVRYKKSADANWTQLLAGAQPSLQLTGLLACTGYEFSVQAICEGNQTSEFAEAKAFLTDCFSNATESPALEAMVEVYPNPFTGELQLEFKLSYPQVVAIELLDSRGSSMLERKLILEAGGHRVDLLQESATSLAPGIYFIKFFTGKGYFIKKVIRQ
ncbi:MAG: hypothetical protein RI973_159 [Bacteroidota bacterium]